MTLLVAYVRQRLTPGRVLPAVVLVVVTALIGRGWSGWMALATDSAAAFGLVIAFRIWDDLMDRERDRARHPKRVVVRASSTRPLAVAALIVAIAAAVLVVWTREWQTSAVLAGYTAILAASYAAAGPRHATREWILLLKYGVFTLVLIGIPAAFTNRGLISAAAAFAAACVYEWLHDAESPVFSLRGSR
jgi:4-hydroxybenzoate polyprenyltransferase